MLEVSGLTKRYGKRTIVEDISFTVPKGEITALIGVNGVGKTTILNAIMNLVPKQAGEVRIDGELLKYSLYEKISFIPDESIMLLEFTIREAMDFMRDFYVSWNEQKAQDILRFFNLKETMVIKELSKGNIAKVNLLLGFAQDSDYILMDEPFNNIDIFTREEIANIFTTTLVEDKGVLITTHEIDEIERLVDHVILLDRTRIAKEFNVEQMRMDEGKSIVDVMREVYQPQQFASWEGDEYE
ncbi:ABC transporter ATP-binding protein [Dolosigranulum pigrum]